MSARNDSLSTREIQLTAEVGHIRKCMLAFAEAVSRLRVSANEFDLFDILKNSELELLRAILWDGDNQLRLCCRPNLDGVEFRGLRHDPREGNAYWDVVREVHANSEFEVLRFFEFSVWEDYCSSVLVCQITQGERLGEDADLSIGILPFDSVDFCGLSGPRRLSKSQVPAVLGRTLID